MSSLPRLSRRRFLQSTALAGTAVAAGTTRVQAATVPLPFLHGVASGDPLPTSVVLWTRITPDADALPGSGLGAATRVRWEVGIDAAFHHVISSGEVRTDAASDHTIHVDPFDLEPDTVYFYRFTVLDGPHAGATSPTGRTRTAPALRLLPRAAHRRRGIVRELGVRLLFGVRRHGHPRTGRRAGSGGLSRRLHLRVRPG
ncbi:PhoD-like phosphatase N-terminal domain-containing protein [Corynebacterium suedekumii]|nr:PhoD-like phosphatase N-terminal domain-containing protein [Corynebacterium suedekumii]